ncbi:TPA: hypothetical protein R2M45_001116 [Campylobacter jejuni]|nr:hypothetical protein [Campylobacter jejuni]
MNLQEIIALPFIQGKKKRYQYPIIIKDLVQNKNLGKINQNYFKLAEFMRE